jgi:TonB family protein
VSIVFDARRSAEQSKRGREATSGAPQSPDSERRSPEPHDRARSNDDPSLQDQPARPVRANARIACSDGSWASDISTTSDAAQAPLVRTLLRMPRLSSFSAKPLSKIAEDRIEPATLIVGRNPVYPRIAKEHLISGNVEVRFRINPEGKTYDVESVKGAPILAADAIDAVKAWRYRPARLNGVPIDSQASTNFDFRVDPDSSGCSVAQTTNQK